MAINQVGTSGSGRKPIQLQGISTDPKPSDCITGSTFYELDTKRGWVYDGANLNPATGNHWWEV